MSTSSRRVTLVSPGCFSIGPESENPGAAHVSVEQQDELNKATVIDTGHHTHEQAMMFWLGHPVTDAGQLPIASYKYSAETGQPVPPHLVCAELVHLQAGTDNARLHPAKALNVSIEDASAVMDTVNELIEPDGLKLFATSAGSWYLSGMPAARLDTWPAHAIANGKIAGYLPRHEKAGDWRRLITEMQMLLHSHPVNETRAQRGQMPVNGMWFWGGAEATVEPGDRLEYPTVFANDAFTSGLLSALNLKALPLDKAYAEDWQAIDNDIILLDLSIYDAWLSSNQTDISDAKNAMRENLIEPIQIAVAQGDIDCFVLDGCEGHAIQEVPLSGSKTGSKSGNGSDGKRTFLRRLLDKTFSQRSKPGRSD